MGVDPQQRSPHTISAGVDPVGQVYLSWVLEQVFW
jgi:hypothetical protein